MTTNLRAVMGNSWLRFVQAMDADIVVITASHVGEAMQFIAAIWRDNGTTSTVSFLRSKDAAPLRVRIPVRPGKDFLFDEQKHDLCNVADIAVFRALHQAALDRLLTAEAPEQNKPVEPFKIIEGGKA